MRTTPAFVGRETAKHPTDITLLDAQTGLTLEASWQSLHIMPPPRMLSAHLVKHIRIMHTGNAMAPHQLRRD